MQLGAPSRGPFLVVLEVARAAPLRLVKAIDADVQASVRQIAARLTRRSTRAGEAHVHPAHGENALQVGLVLHVRTVPLSKVWRISACLRQPRTGRAPRMLPDVVETKDRLPALFEHLVQQLHGTLT